MRLRALPLITTLAAGAFGLMADSARAATLFDTTGHDVRVAVGRTTSISSTDVRFTSGPASTLDTCSGSTLNLTVTQNNDAKLILVVTGGTFSGCAPFSTVTPTFSGTSSPWALTVSGTGIVSGTQTQWTAALHNFSYDAGNGNYRGNLSNILAYQPNAATSPVCLQFASSGSFTGPLTGGGRLDAVYCLEGFATAWSLTN